MMFALDLLKHCKASRQQRSALHRSNSVRYFSTCSSNSSARPITSSIPGGTGAGPAIEIVTWANVDSVHRVLRAAAVLILIQG
jgi:hypothetical protein